MQNYISFSLHDLQFIDSLQFLPASLKKLVTNLDIDKFHIMKEHFGNNVIELLTRKEIYPYSYVDKKEKFEEKSLPPKKEFRIDINGEEISDEDYHHAENVWQCLNIQSLGDSHDLYIKTNILFPADIFQNF